MKWLLFLLMTQLSVSAFCQERTIEKQKWHFNNDLKQDTSAGYAQVVKVDNVLYISGAVSRDISIEGITRLYQTLEASLKSFGATFQHVVKENLYTTDIEAVKKNNSARKIFYKGDFPAATWVQITRLFTADAKLEVELIAHLPK